MNVSVLTWQHSCKDSDTVTLSSFDLDLQVKDDTEVTSAKVSASSSQETETSRLLKDSSDSNSSEVYACEGFWV